MSANPLSRKSELAKGLACALCGRPVRSVYALPGERNVKLCAACFFKSPPTTVVENA